MRTFILAAVLLAVVAAGCGKEKTPPRDQIPILKERIFALQEAVKDRNRAAIDSLLSVKIVSNQQDSDSLLSLVYGPADDFAFDRFGSVQINYTARKSLMECFIMDSTSQLDRPLLLSWVHEHDMWLLKRFEVGTLSSDADSVVTDSR